MTAPTASADVRDAIAATNREIQSAFAAGDAGRLARCYTSGAMLLPPGADRVTGGERIEAFWRDILNLGIKGAQLETLEAEQHGDIAHEVGRYGLTGEGGQVVDRGKYVVLWKQEQGRWKLHRDIWNSSGEAR